MKRRIISLVTVICLLMLMTASFAFAAEEQYAEEEGIAPAAVPEAASKTFADKYGNKYRISGVSIMTGKTAKVKTQFTVTYYVGGKKGEVDAYTKTLTGTGRVWFHGAASNNSFTKSSNMTGNDGTFVASDSYDFLIKSMHSTHQGSCQGGSTSFYTMV